jgi:hypothetical protein
MSAAQWTCYSNFITCRPDAGGNEHLLKYGRSGFHADMRGLSGHAFFECKQCQPATFFFAVFHTAPDPYVVCYAIGEESFRLWDRDQSATTKTTPEMLHLLRDPEGRSINPNWRPLK